MDQSLLWTLYTDVCKTFCKWKRMSCQPRLVRKRHGSEESSHGESATVSSIFAWSLMMSYSTSWRLCPLGWWFARHHWIWLPCGVLEQQVWFSGALQGLVDLSVHKILEKISINTAQCFGKYRKLNPFSCMAAKRELRILSAQGFFWVCGLVWDLCAFHNLCVSTRFSAMSSLDFV